MAKIWNNLAKMHVGKKVYAGLWLVTGIFLIVFIAVCAAFAKQINDKTSVVKGYTELESNYSKTLFNQSVVNDTVVVSAKNQPMVLVKDVKVTEADKKLPLFIGSDGKKTDNLLQFDKDNKVTFAIHNNTSVQVTIASIISHKFDKVIQGANNYLKLDETLFSKNIISGVTKEDKEVYLNGNNETKGVNNLEWGKFKTEDTLTSKGTTAQNTIAGIGFGFAVTLAGAVFTTAAVSLYLKKTTKGGKK